MNLFKRFVAAILGAWVAVVVLGSQLALADSATAPDASITPQSSYNWAGYVDNNPNITSITGSWTVPQVSGNNFSADATWIGIGGINSQDLIQAGTQAIVDSSGEVSYQAWYETLPSFSAPADMSVKPGDVISTSLIRQDQSSNQWLISLRDDTSGQSFQTTVTYNSSLSSGEWVDEMPSQGSGQFIPLDNFGSLNFTAGSVTQNGQYLTIGQSGAQSITMLNAEHQALATVSPLTPDGTGFSVSRTTAASDTTIVRTLTFRRRGSRGGGMPTAVLSSWQQFQQQQLKLLRQQLEQFYQNPQFLITFTFFR